MKWAKKYISIYNQPLDNVHEGIIQEIKQKLAKVQSDEPVVTVSVIAYNEERHLLPCLWALSEMRCEYPVEIIGVNNDSSDRTGEIFRLVGLPHYLEKRHSCGYARQCGLDHARGRYHINIDADTMYPPLYVQILVDHLRIPGHVACCSSWSYIPDERHSRLDLFFYELSRDIYLYFLSFKRPELSVRGLVFAYHTEPARRIGIRVDIKRGEDGTLAMHLREVGKIVFIHDRKARAVTGYGTVGQDGSLLNSLKVRVYKALRNIHQLFTKQEKYQDEESNLIK